MHRRVYRSMPKCPFGLTSSPGPVGRWRKTRRRLSKSESRKRTLLVLRVLKMAQL